MHNNKYSNVAVLFKGLPNALFLVILEAYNMKVILDPLGVNIQK